MKPITYKDELVVPPEVIDDLNHVNNVTYLRWVQDVGEKHWKAKAPEDIREKYGWVVLNHFIEYKHPAFKGDTLTLTTWIENYSGVKCERRTEIHCKTDNKLVAKAKTLWCFIDLERQKPKRIQPEIAEPFFES